MGWIMKKEDYFDNKIIFKDINLINDNEYLKRLYKIYLLVKHYSDNDEVSLDKLNEIEDYIFTVNGKTLNQKERIELEFNEILNKYEEVNPVKQKEVELYIGIARSLLNYDLNEKNILYIKKVIALIKSILGLNTGFLYAGYLVFKEKMRNIYMDNSNYNVYNKTKDYSIYDNYDSDKGLKH